MRNRKTAENAYLGALRGLRGTFVLVGLFTAGIPDWLTILGFGLALVAVWWISATGTVSTIQLSELGLPVAAGLAIGVFSVVLAAATAETLGWPLLAARVTSTTGLLVLALALRKPWCPTRAALPLTLLAGVLDAGGNIFFALAAQIGRLDTAAVLSGLYPAFTALLALIVLKEQLAPWQWAGLALAIGAVMLISV